MVFVWIPICPYLLHISQPSYMETLHSLMEKFEYTVQSLGLEKVGMKARLDKCSRQMSENESV